MLCGAACSARPPVVADGPREVVTPQSAVGDDPPPIAAANEPSSPEPAASPIPPPFPALPEPTHANRRCPPGMAFVPGGRWTSTQLARVKRVTVEGRAPWAYGVVIAPAVSDFCLDLTEVTFGAVARCIARGACPMLGLDPKAKRATQVNRLNSLLDGSDLEAWKQAWDSGAKLPISGTSPREVIEICGGLGARVPTLEEWLWAAWGGRQDRKHPWGKTPADPTRLNIRDYARTEWSGDGEYIDEDGFNAEAPVGSYPRGAGRWGHLDLAGNVAETVFPTLASRMFGAPGRPGRTNDDLSECFDCGLDFSYDDEKSPVSVANFKTCEREPGNESCPENTFRDWRMFPCAGPSLSERVDFSSAVGFRCATDPVQVVSE